MFSKSLLLLLAASSVMAHPTPTGNGFIIPASETPVIGSLGITIHTSCNFTERAQLLAALDDTSELVLVARQHLLETGRSDPTFIKYFGANGTTNQALGLFDRIAYAEKPNVLFRCDDPDRNCELNPTWAGHHRGSNATSETVICEPSYVLRQRLTQMCTQGYTVAAGATNTFWASDLLHRVFHVEAITEGLVSHIADDYDTSLELALEDPVAAIGNSDSLQYFALEVYASRIAVPGVGCLGEVVEEVNEVHATTAPAAVVETAVPETATSTDAHVHAVETTAAAVAAGKECHTHDDGVEHCS